MHRLRARIPAALTAVCLAASFLAVAAVARKDSAAAAAAGRPSLTVVVAVDGLAWKRLEQYRPYFTAGLKRLLDEGLVHTACRYRHLNTETGPGHASLGTGAPPRVTGIVANRWFEPRADGSFRTVYCTDEPRVDPATGKEKVVATARNLRVPTLGDRLVARFPGSRVVTLSGKDRAALFLAGHDRSLAPYWWDQDTGRFVTTPAHDTATGPGAAVARIVARFNGTRAGGYLPRRFGLRWARMGEPLLPAAQLAALPRPAPFEQQDLYQVPQVGLGWDHDLTRDDKGYFAGVYHSPFVDELVADLALAVLGDKELELGRRAEPDLLGLSFSAQDTVSHNYGPESEENLDVLRRLDVQLGRVFMALDEALPGGKVVLALSADHGFLVIPEAEKKRDRSFRGGRLVSGSYAMTGLLEKLNRAVSEDLCLPAGSKPLHGTEGFNVKYNHPALPALRTEAGPCGAAGRPVVPADLDRVLPRAVARLYAEEVKGVLLVSQRDAWNREDPDVPFALNALDVERTGDAMLVPQRNVLVHWDPGRGTGHGSQYDNDTNVPLVLWGGPFRAGRSDADVAPYDLAPTLGKLLDVTLPDAVGRPIGAEAR